MSSMRLSEYLAARDERQTAFAARSGVPQTTISSVCRGEVPNLRTADRIVEASKAEPAPCGGTVTFQDLLPQSEQVAA